jgi:hypothetical protein
MNKLTTAETKEIEELEAQTPAINYATLDEALKLNLERAEQIVSTLNPQALNVLRKQNMNLTYHD